ncbi:Mov34/MPN/PAD-1 family protein [Methylobacterium oryzae]|nr:Mov34/MPN/PAD-1 family protein [Methylobacterium oryzae]
MKILLPKAVSAVWRRELKQAGQREIGGVLLGEALGGDEFRVLEASLQRDGGSPARFVRDPEHHGKAIRDFHERTGHDYRRFNYLGEWHSHPSFPTRPSQDDVCAMREILADGRVGATFACLLILRHRPFRRLDIGASVFTPDGGISPVLVKRER